MVVRAGSCGFAVTQVIRIPPVSTTFPNPDECVCEVFRKFTSNCLSSFSLPASESDLSATVSGLIDSCQFVAICHTCPVTIWQESETVNCDNCHSPAWKVGRRLPAVNPANCEFDCPSKTMIQQNFTQEAAIREFLRNQDPGYRGSYGRTSQVVISVCLERLLNLEGITTCAPIPQFARSTVQIWISIEICRVVHGDTSADFLAKVDSECVNPQPSPVSPKVRPT